MDRAWLQGCLLACLALVCCGAPAAQGSALEPFRWKNRLLLIFAPEVKHPELLGQNQVIAKCPGGFLERDMRIIRIVGEETTLDGRSRPDWSAGELRQKFKVSGKVFALVLVGKDGRRKLTSPRVVGREKLFTTIDAMPMRRQEMRERTSSGCDT